MNKRSTGNNSRKKFLLWGAAAVSAVALLKWLPGGKQPKPEKTKMLAQDGTLVEVDLAALKNSNKKKITNKELQNWIKK